MAVLRRSPGSQGGLFAQALQLSGVKLIALMHHNLQVIREARKREIQGGIIYDALHAEIARRVNVEKNQGMMTLVSNSVTRESPA